MFSSGGSKTADGASRVQSKLEQQPDPVITVSYESPNEELVAADFGSKNRTVPASRKQDTGSNIVHKIEEEPHSQRQDSPKVQQQTQ